MSAVDAPSVRMHLERHSARGDQLIQPATLTPRVAAAAVAPIQYDVVGSNARRALGNRNAERLHVGSRDPPLDVRLSDRHSGQHPTKVDKKKLKRVSLHHWSWTQVLAEAVMQKEFRGVADPDQAWILGELIRYLEHPRSGALEFDDMGEAWVSVRDAVAASTLRSTNKGVTETCARSDALLRFASLRLGRQLGAEVTPVLTRADLADPSRRTQAMVARSCAEGLLSGSIRIPDAVAPITVTADLRASRIDCSVDIDARERVSPPLG